MAKIILIHGSWHWAGCFHKLQPLLIDAGHKVKALNNASHGDDPTPWEAVDSMATYNTNIIEKINSAGQPVVLVGHSMGGVSLSHLAEAMPEKVAKLIYIAAFMTRPGETAHDRIMAHAQNPVCAALSSLLSPVKDGAGIEIAADKPDEVKEAFFADCSDEDIALSAANVVRINTSVPNLYAPTTITDHERHYIACREDRAIPLEAQHEMIAKIPGVIVHEMGTSHSPFYSQPEALAKIILGAI